jgi:hypothetical protein
MNCFVVVGQKRRSSTAILERVATLRSIEMADSSPVGTDISSVSNPLTRPKTGPKSGAKHSMTT